MDRNAPSIGGSLFGMIKQFSQESTVKPISSCNSRSIPLLGGSEVNPLTDLGMMTMMTMKAPLLVGQGLISLDYERMRSFYYCYYYYYYYYYSYYYYLLLLLFIIIIIIIYCYYFFFWPSLQTNDGYRTSWSCL